MMLAYSFLGNLEGKSNSC